MKVILNADVENLGEEGDVCDVKDGYGRNYLLPKKLALPYNKTNLAFLEHRREAIEKRKEDKRQAALSLKERIEDEPLIIRRPTGETGKLFGSVTAATLAEELEKKGIQVEKKRIVLQEHNIKMTGNYSAQIKLYDDEVATLKFSVEPVESESGKEAAAPEKEAVKTEQAEAAAEAPVSEKAAETVQETAGGEEAEPAAEPEEAAEPDKAAEPEAGQAEAGQEEPGPEEEKTE